jgi:phosphoglycerol transferase MdoB-like AlkP superfamily enzyme
MNASAAGPRPWSAHVALPLTIGIAYLLVGALTRLALYTTFGVPAGIAAISLPSIMLLGALNDLVTLAYLLLPVTALLVMVPFDDPGRRWHRPFAFGLLAATLFGMLFLMLAEYLYFEEFDARFNLVAVDYVRYPTEVLVNIQESYPVLPIVLGTAAIALGIAWAVCRHLSCRIVGPASVRGRVAGFALNVMLAIVAAITLSTDSFAGAQNRVARELTVNGVSAFFRALETNELDFHRYYRVLPAEAAQATLRAELAATGVAVEPDADGRLMQSVAPDATGFGRLNVVVIVEESLGANHVSALEAKKPLTPNLDRLAAQGVLFTSAYATGTRTVRGLEAVNLSLPPAPGESVLKRPGSAGLRSWGEVMHEHGYRTSFLYGGYAYFDGMGEFFGGNGHTVVDRADIEAPRFANIWGVSDGDLFDQALTHLEAEHATGAPFFALILTTSNHKPYTFPAGIPGIPAKGGGRQAGVRYADHALGGFFDAAARRAWYADTLFVVLGDHGARVYGAAEIPVGSYRVPILMFAPGRLAPRRVAEPISQIDVAPTVLGLLGLGWQAPFFGRDVLRHPAADRPVYLQHNYTVGMLTGERLALLGFQHHAEVVGYERGTERFTPAAADPVLLDRATAVFQSAYDLYDAQRDDAP